MAAGSTRLHDSSSQKTNISYSPPCNKHELTVLLFLRPLHIGGRKEFRMKSA
jgi:hypothetical protein